MELKFKGSITAIIFALGVIGLGLSNLAAQKPTRSVWDGVYTKEQAERGRGEYKSECEDCHGLALDGDDGPPLAGVPFLSNWDGLTLNVLFDRIKTTMPANRPGSISREASADILSYILRFNRFPAGDQELPQQSELLKQIRIEANPPAGNK